jgi:hypothetical protein
LLIAFKRAKAALFKSGSCPKPTTTASDVWKVSSKGTVPAPRQTATLRPGKPRELAGDGTMKSVPGTLFVLNISPSPFNGHLSHKLQSSSAAAAAFAHMAAVPSGESLPPRRGWERSADADAGALSASAMGAWSD